MRTKFKKFISIFLAAIMICGMITIAPISVSAVTSSIKTQAEAVTWLKAQGGASYNIDTSTSGTQCVEFVKVYVNWLLKGNPWSDAWGRGTGNGWEVWKNSLWSELGWTVYYNTADFMPQPGDIFSSGTTAYGHTGVVISSNLNTAVVADANVDSPYNGTPVKVHTITWKSATSNSAYGATHYIRPVFKTTHTHNYNTYVYYGASHPHYSYYKCSCGDVIANKNETRVLDTCPSCLAEYKATVNIDKELYFEGETVNISWSEVSGATHYFLWIWKMDENGEYKPYSNNNRLITNSFSIPNIKEGNYEIRFYTYNSNYWMVDGSDWFRSEADRIYFTVVNNVLPENVALNQTNIKISKGSTAELSATVYPSNAINKDVSWSSSNTSVATVDSNGKVTATGIGTATITVKTSNDKTAICNVTVNPFLGDANCNGDIDIDDITLIQKYIADIVTIDDTQLKYADVDSDGGITVLDATLIQKYIAGIITSLE